MIHFRPKLTKLTGGLRAPIKQNDMDKRKFCMRFMVITAVVVAVAMLVFGLLFGKVVEESLFAEIAKWVVMYFPICAIFETFAYVLSQLFWHVIYDGKDSSLD